MKIATTIEEVRQEVREWKRQGLTVGLVPTMGALHEGHASLVERAYRDCNRVVASVFVNPTQFAADEDLESYPRDFEEDCRILQRKGCHLVFHPSVSEMYPEGFATYVELTSDMTKQLCGKTRPGHFKGVCTVVSKLFNIVTPDKAYFGEKDAQQLAVIRRMVFDMAMDVKIVGCPTVREADGLAKSSRNDYLNDDERKAACVLYRALQAALEYIGDGPHAVAVSAPGTSAGPCTEASNVLPLIRNIIAEEPLAEIDYIEIVDGETLQPVEIIKAGDLIAIAIYIGKTRLIDNVRV
ncbi:MAG: pantoate--beta-alanine ligase [Bacillota bacterium]|nr:pantoate--beta-alanine ligase [Bacillota bacterium]